MFFIVNIWKESFKCEGRGKKIKLEELVGRKEKNQKQKRMDRCSRYVCLSVFDISVFAILSFTDFVVMLFKFLKFL